jgi:hypothetical protein
VRGTQIFFIKKAIPWSIHRLRISKLPLTKDLASALRRLRISTFNDLVGVSLRDFQRVSDKSSALFLELSRLIKVVATGNGGSLSASRVRPNRLRNNRCSSFRAHTTRVGMLPLAPKRDKSHSLSLIKLKVGELDFLVGGPPCQGFSPSGKRWLADNRNKLIARFIELAHQLQPKCAIIENVPTALSAF